MGGTIRSLLAGRNARPLTERQVRQVTSILVGMEPQRVAYEYQSDGFTAFRVQVEEGGEVFGEIVIGPDIYPGSSMVDANSMLGPKAAIAHELTHYHRWVDGIELPLDDKRHLDEALTSLQAIGRYASHLSEVEVRQLVADAIQRIQLYLEESSVDERE